jgi:hypothetical protein
MISRKGMEQYIMWPLLILGFLVMGLLLYGIFSGKLMAMMQPILGLFGG